MFLTAEEKTMRVRGMLDSFRADRLTREVVDNMTPEEKIATMGNLLHAVEVFPTPDLDLIVSKSRQILQGWNDLPPYPEVGAE